MDTWADQYHLVSHASPQASARDAPRIGLVICRAQESPQEVFICRLDSPDAMAKLSQDADGGGGRWPVHPIASRRRSRLAEGTFLKPHGYGVTIPLTVATGCHFEIDNSDPAVGIEAGA
ncbi:hypothetical protein ACTHRK_16625 [Dietzia cercidiphylli]|uniref:hypothetical protein n=1 Tax=Dietzia cercidiphylli TaxID=498199 RepID=UPI003F7E7CD6